MLRTVLLGRTGVILAMPTPPFTPDDISQTFEDLAAGHRPGMDLSTPIIVDARGAPLLNDGQMGIGQVVLRRKFLQRRQPAAPLVTVVPNLK